jgi:alcohol dehydrogenase, propanol-preferring
MRSSAKGSKQVLVRPHSESDNVSAYQWLGHTCGRCVYCTSGRENLRAGARSTDYQVDGGYAQYAVPDARFCFALPEGAAMQKPLPCFAQG